MDQVKQQRVVNDGRGADLFLIMLVNYLLKVVTLGIYHFWAKTRVRNYMWSHTLIDDERLQYTGTGGELFVGFLKAVGLFIGFSISFVIVQTIVGALPSPLGTVLGGILFFALLVLLMVGVGAVLYQVNRYMLTRTNYRGIRCGLVGSAWYYGLLNAGLMLAASLTLYLTLPWARMHLYRYSLNNHYFGSKRLEFEGSASDVYGYFFVCWLLAIPTLGLSLLAYRLHELRYVASRVSLDGVGCSVELYFWPYVGLLITNFLLLVFTLGLAYPWVKLRNVRFLLERVELVGEPDYPAIRQEMAHGDAVGEGFAEALDGAFA